MNSTVLPCLASRTLAAGLVAAACMPAMAQSPAQAWYDSRFVVNLGTFVVGTDLEARLDGEFTGDNEEVDFDETFGLGKNATRWRVDALWRIAPRHQLRLGYFDYSNSRTKVIDRDIEWGDYTFSAGGEVKASYESEIYVLSYEYSFVRQPTYEIAAGIGVHYSNLSFKLSGNATLTDENGNVVDQGVVNEAANAPVPLPVIGLRGTWVVSPNVVLEAAGSAFSANYDAYDGVWYQLRAGATWMFNRNFGLGVGYTYFRTEVDVDRDSFRGSLTTNYSGLQVFLTGAF
ncbi:MAG: hypothetical protein HXY24_16655 [Rubrivivax sp.]|nr:hypothetical protein [Rubrivivax sp.]